jgi:uracil-DNA glycosylase
MPKLRFILCLGRIAHDSALKLFGEKAKAYPFAHGAVHRLSGARGLTLCDSYHCSRYNTNTGVLTQEMFDSVFARLAQEVRAG